MRALEGMERNGLIRRGADVAAVSVILMVLWLGLVEHAIAHCLETDTETATSGWAFRGGDTIKT